MHAGLRGNDIVEEGRLADATVTPNDENATHSATRDLKKVPEFLTLQVAAHEHGPMVAWLPLGTSLKVGIRATPTSDEYGCLIASSVSSVSSVSTHNR